MIGVGAGSGDETFQLHQELEMGFGWSFARPAFRSSATRVIIRGSKYDPEAVTYQVAGFKELASPTPVRE